ncbi:PREDICTED: uncharacterized protein LOC109179511 [Ipomoea nil]|uniref:uncharacterized protein LOC109179511 n=1 Tax=Ipomoea nil TaxID=35883 RepID=UPI00090154EA|nr:PREDICTED: uncharacterized protein LOC109179511 [Ipomoea nil]
MEKVLNMALKVERKINGSLNQRNIEVLQSNAVQNSQGQSTEDSGTVAFSASNNKKKFGNNGGKNVAKCTYCNMSGHTVEKCFKKHGYPPAWIPGYKSRNRQNQDAQSNAVNQIGDIGLSAEQFQRLVSLLHGQNQEKPASSNATITMNNYEKKSGSNEGKFISDRHINNVISSSAIWILDSGATDHITCSLDYFERYHRVCGVSVKLPNGGTVSVTHIGDIRLQLNLLPNGGTVSVTHIGDIRLQLNLLLNNVLFIPSFTFNIISASKLTKQGACKIIMNSDSYNIQGPFGMMDGFTEQRNGLYVITDPPKKRNCQIDEMMESNSVSLHLWHYIPQQNGVAERKHQLFLSVARALRFQSGVPMEFWNHYVMHAIYLINRLPPAKPGEKSPFEFLFGRTVEYHHLKAFGCLCFGSTMSHGKSKMEPRAKKFLFLGIPANVKGYVLYDIANKHVFISMDVQFYEHIYPFKEDKSEAYDEKNMFDPVLPLVPVSIEVSIPPLDTTANQNQVLGEAATPSLSIHNTEAPERASRSSPLPYNIDSVDTYVSTNNEFSNETGGNTMIQDEAVQIDVHLEPRRSERTRHIPTRLQDYYCHSLSTGSHHSRSSPHSINKVISYEGLSPSHRVCANSILTIQEPQSYNEAVKEEAWRKAMQCEIDALVENKTWVLTDLPPGKTPIGCKLVYKVKHRADGSIERHKARLVAKGYTQQLGVDYVETFSPVARMTTIRTFLAVAVAKGWDIKQLDINNAFLHGDLDEEVYMISPPGFQNNKQQVC